MFNRIKEFAANHQKRTIIALLFFIVLVREVGVLDLNIYTGKTAGSNSVSMRNVADNETLSYKLLVVKDNKTIASIPHYTNSQPPVTIVAKITSVSYTGNYFLPLYKSFKAAYQCEITMPDGSRKGDMQGEIEYEIVGLCSIRSARRFIIADAVKQIRHSFIR